MGFDLYVMLNLMIDENTGFPIVYPNGIKDTFHILEYQVPLEYRRFIQQRGHWFSNYILHFEGNQASAEYFLDHYPEWEDGIEGYEDEPWTKEDHDAFKKALEWFALKGVFIVSWSY